MHAVDGLRGSRIDCMVIYKTYVFICHCSSFLYQTNLPCIPVCWATDNRVGTRHWNLTSSIQGALLRKYHYLITSVIAHPDLPQSDFDGLTRSPIGFFAHPQQCSALRPK